MSVANIMLDCRRMAKILSEETTGRNAFQSFRYVNMFMDRCKEKAYHSKHLGKVNVS